MADLIEQERDREIVVVPLERRREMHPARVLRPVWWLRSSGWRDKSLLIVRRSRLAFQLMLAPSLSGTKR